jgi:EAL domain-containing protein (putative c-di-GMP-specific phosphodiesterase class I)
MRQFVATHPRKAALALASLAGAICLVCSLAAAVLVQHKVIALDLDASATRILSIRAELNEVLVRLNAEVIADCSEKTLRKLRATLVHTSFIADLGVVNPSGDVLCNTTAGLLESPVALGEPDWTGKTPEGWLTSIYQHRRLPGVDSTQPTVITVNGRFAAAPPSSALGELFIEKLSAVQQKSGTNGQAKTAGANVDLTDEWRKLLVTHAFVNRPIRFYDWERSAFVHTMPIRGTHYVVQRVVPVSAFFATYLSALQWGALLSLMLAWLVYFALRPVFLSWRALEYRIGSLLTSKNLLCMYQPIIEMATGKPTGCEVLMRLRDGDSILRPDIAIPAIIQRDLTWELDQLVVQVAVAELKQSLPELADFKVAFNFFPSSVSGGKIGEMVAAVLDMTPHAGLQFDVEVLEQEYKDSLIKAVADLRAHQFLISVDDFGTGFSNLGSIKALLPDFLKIDRSFVHDMESASIRSSLIPEIIGIGRAVGAELIAEGIENERQYAMLLDMGVEYGQGYFMCRPLPIDGFAAYLRKFA